MNFDLAEKFFRWRYFIPKGFLFLHQFHQFPEKYLCRPSCFKDSGSQSGKKFLISTTVKFPISNLNHDLQNISNWKQRTKFYTSMIFSNQWVTKQVHLPHLMLLLLPILIFWYFDISLITVLTFHKNVSSIRVSKLHTCVLSIIFFSVSKPKSNIKIFIENQLAIKTNQLTDL